MPAADPTSVTEHPEFCFPDGNVVFLIGTGPAVAFRLHRGIVNRWSQTFHAMLANLEATTDPLTFQGHGAIELNDCEADFDRLVRVMYDGTIASLPTECTSETFSQLASVLFLSQKYRITHLFDHVRIILLAAYPLTLSAWDMREAYVFNAEARYTWLDSIRRHAPPLGVVSLALQLDAPHLLVPAYLDLARRPVSEIIRGFTTTTSMLNYPAGLTLHLRPKQTTAVLRGKETLQRFIADFIKSDVESRAPAPHCLHLNLGPDAGPSPCAVAFGIVAHEMLVMTADVTDGVDSDPLFVLSYAEHILGELSAGRSGARERGTGACPACTDWFRQSLYAGRQHVWRCLDKWFDLRKVLEEGFEAGGWE